MSVSMKTHIATSLMTSKRRLIPSFWIQCETRVAITEKRVRNYRQWFAGLPKPYIKSRYEFGEAYFPVFATSVEMDDNKGLISFTLTTLTRDAVCVDFKPLATVLNLDDMWWRLKFEEEGSTNWGRIPYIDGKVFEGFPSTYAFKI